jgi:hypothetical protein
MVDTWQAIANKVSWGVYLSDGTRVALVNTALEKQEAKARLISAAPELLEALRNCTSRLESAREELVRFQKDQGADDDVQNIAANDADENAILSARAALSKALGEPQ